MKSRIEFLQEQPCPCGASTGIEEIEHERGGTSWCCKFCQRSWDPIYVLMKKAEQDDGSSK